MKSATPKLPLAIYTVRVGNYYTGPDGTPTDNYRKMTMLAYDVMDAIGKFDLMDSEFISEVVLDARSD